MPQNLISLTLTEADHAAIADERRSLNKMGEKSETFCRRTLVAMSENPGPQGSKAPFAGLFSWAFALQRFARKPDLVEANLTRVARR
jgi:hypothetical protein